MEKNISEDLLLEILNKFRNVLNNYDFSEIKNIIFYDLESLNFYLMTYKNNPFERQFQEMEKLLDQILPYLPSNFSCDTIDVFNQILSSKKLEGKRLKEHLDFNMKLDFIERVKSFETEQEWEILINTCKQIRAEKEFALLQER